MPVTTYTTIDGETVSQDVNGTVHDLLPDPLGHTVGLIGSGQGIEFEYTYWPYEEVGSIDDVATALRYVGTLGYYSDDYGSPRVYVRARHYRGPYGRWLTVDPLWPEEQAYIYSQATPFVFADPSGLGVKETCSALRYDCEKCRDYIIKKLHTGVNMIGGSVGVIAIVGFAGGGPITKGVCTVAAVVGTWTIIRHHSNVDTAEAQMSLDCLHFYQACLKDSDIRCDAVARKHCFGLHGSLAYLTCYASEYSKCIGSAGGTKPPPARRKRMPSWVYRNCPPVWHR